MMRCGTPHYVENNKLLLKGEHAAPAVLNDDVTMPREGACTRAPAVYYYRREGGPKVC
jgi:hypothetical protein